MEARYLLIERKQDFLQECKPKVYNIWQTVRTIRKVANTSGMVQHACPKWWVHLRRCVRRYLVDASMSDIHIRKNVGIDSIVSTLSLDPHRIGGWLPVHIGWWIPIDL